MGVGRKLLTEDEIERFAHMILATDRDLALRFTEAMESMGESMTDMERTLDRIWRGDPRARQSARQCLVRHHARQRY